MSISLPLTQQKQYSQLKSHTELLEVIKTIRSAVKITPTLDKLLNWLAKNPTSKTSNGVLYMLQKSLAAAVDCSVRSIHTALQELERLGFIVRLQKQHTGKKMTADTIIFKNLAAAEQVAADLISKREKEIEEEVAALFSSNFACNENDDKPCSCKDEQPKNEPEKSIKRPLKDLYNITKRNIKRNIEQPRFNKYVSEVLNQFHFDQESQKIINEKLCKLAGKFKFKMKDHMDFFKHALNAFVWQLKNKGVQKSFEGLLWVVLTNQYHDYQIAIENEQKAKAEEFAAFYDELAEKEKAAAEPSKESLLNYDPYELENEYERMNKEKKANIKKNFF